MRRAAPAKTAHADDGVGAGFTATSGPQVLRHGADHAAQHRTHEEARRKDAAGVATPG